MGATTAPTTKTDAKTDAPKQSTAMQVKGIESLLITPAIADQMRKVATKYLTPERLTRIMLSEVARPDKDGKLSLLETAQKNPGSFLRAVMLCAQLGLEPGPMGMIYLIPYNGEIQAMPGFKGYVNLACRSGFRDVDADVIYANDEFDWARGTEPFIRHKPRLTDRGEMIGAYAIAWPDNGGPPRFCVLNMEDIAAARAVSVSFQRGKGPWIDFPGEMAKKTAIRRGQKLWNLTPDSPLALAASLDDDAIEATATVQPQRKAPPTLRAALSIDQPTHVEANDDGNDGHEPEAA